MKKLLVIATTVIIASTIPARAQYTPNPTGSPAGAPAQTPQNALVGTYTSQDRTYPPQLVITGIDAAGNVSGSLGGAQYDRSAQQMVSWAFAFGGELKATFHGNHLSLVWPATGSHYELTYGNGVLSGPFVSGRNPGDSGDFTFRKR